MKDKKMYLKLLLLTALVLLISSTASFAATLANVTGLTVSIKDEKAYLEWNKVSNASGYEVYINVSERGYVHIGNVSQNKVTIKGFVSGKTYFAKIRAYSYENGEKIYGGYSQEVSIKISNTGIPEKVQNLKLVIGSDQIARLSWEKVTNAVKYEVYVKRANEQYKKIGTVSKNAVNVRGFIEGEIYKMKIRAVDADQKCGEFSQEVTFRIGKKIQETVKVEKVTGLKGTVTGSKVTLSWDAVSNAEGYEICMSIPSQGNVTIRTTGTSKTISGLTQTGYSYDTKVRAYKTVNGKRVYGEYSNIIEIFAEKEQTTEPSTETIKLDKVTGLSGTVTGDTVALKWNKVDGADGYEINMVIPGYGSTNMTTTETSKSISGLTEKEYSYDTKVRAYKTVNGARIYGEYSDIIKVYAEAEKEETVKLGKVTGLSGTVTGDTVALKWNKVDGADGYEINMVIPGYGSTNITTTETSKSISGLTEKEYSYDTKVRAYKTVNGAKIYGEYSDIIEIYAK